MEKNTNHKENPIIGIFPKQPSRTCIGMKACCQMLVCLTASHQSVLPMPTFHTPFLGIMQHNDVYFVALQI
jgi:hypothetical protein